MQSQTPAFAGRDELTREPKINRPHVVILGAGASVAAFPDGDRAGRKLPTMDSLSTTVGLDELLKKSGINKREINFETLFSRIAEDRSQSGLVDEIKVRIRRYFSSLEIGSEPNIYDILLLSMRKKDAVITFNWDPFLYDAWIRNREYNLPAIFFLHGNVRAAYCVRHPSRWAAPWLTCSECQSALTPSELLYPTYKKNYSSDIFIRNHWKSAKLYLRNAWAITIFGYSAPDSDIDAVSMLKDAWDEREDRPIERIEIIDIKEHSIMYDKWSGFIRHYHYDYRESFFESYVARYPRRSCEALYAATVEGRPAQIFPLSSQDTFGQMYQYIDPLIEHENKCPEGST